LRQTVHPGRALDILTPAEAAELLEARFRETVEERIRAAATIKLDGSGNGQDEVYGVPLGFEFEARRVTLDLDTATDPSTGNVALNVAGKSVSYLRSGTRIEYAAPLSPNAVPQVPGVQSWGEEQGPYLRNGEVFEVRAVGLTAASILDVTLEGILRRPPPKRDHGRR
jgi:hypothetical protein